VGSISRKSKNAKKHHHNLRISTGINNEVSRISPVTRTVYPQLSLEGDHCSPSLWQWAPYSTGTNRRLFSPIPLCIENRNEKEN
jgi:hypothetical protein